VKLIRNFLPVAFVVVAFAASQARADTTIVIIRHGEKPAQGLGQLTCQGLNRSLALAPRLLASYGKPVALYATNPAQKKKDHGIPYAYVRPLATIEPLAIRSGMPVNLDFGMTDIEPLAAQLTATSGTKVVAWEHHWAQMGANPASVPRWADDDFDSIFVIRENDSEGGSRQVTFSHEYEGLNGLPMACPSPVASR
jgi:hypothetical protein